MGFPLCRDVPQRQVNKLHVRLIAGEMTSVTDRLADRVPRKLQVTGDLPDWHPAMQLILMDRRSRPHYQHLPSPRAALTRGELTNSIWQHR